VLAITGLSLLLVVPVYALSRFAALVDWRVLAGAALALSLVTFFAHRSDKRRAEAGEWRIPESTLHIAELVGGWPGAFLAQRTFRHKTSKTSYQVVFWIIVLLHQIVAVDSLVDWRFTKDVLQLIKSTRPNRRNSDIIDAVPVISVVSAQTCSIPARLTKAHSRL
jgi:uncharacterized membrane protein YsdA (DUF1294 family)